MYFLHVHCVGSRDNTRSSCCSCCSTRSYTPFHVVKGVQSRVLKRVYATLIVRRLQCRYCILQYCSLVIVLTLHLHYVSVSRHLKCTFGTFIEWLRGYAPTFRPPSDNSTTHKTTHSHPKHIIYVFLQYSPHQFSRFSTLLLQYYNTLVKCVQTFGLVEN